MFSRSVKGYNKGNVRVSQGLVAETTGKEGSLIPELRRQTCFAAPPKIVWVLHRQVGRCRKGFLEMQQRREDERRWQNSRNTGIKMPSTSLAAVVRF